ncbi:MAG TPA: energy-coupling factor ABC transporter substrate-binding protein [Pseudonocardia sp.]|nr:energy-coupling factor ABC transporter substrate-binding protein [Pseudonocardia sp.]
MSADPRFGVVNGLLVLAVLVLAAVPLVFVGSATEFGGADGVAAETIETDNPEFEPWADPLFEPEAETASGLFALQAAIGAGVLGYVFGVVRTRRRLPEARRGGSADVERLQGDRADTTPAGARPADGDT